MVNRWVANSHLDAEKRFRGIFDYNDLWMLETAFRDSVDIQRKGRKMKMVTDHFPLK